MTDIKLSGRMLALFEIILMILILVLSKVLSSLEFFQDSNLRNIIGPGSVIISVLLATFFLRRRGLHWRDIGMRWPIPAKSTFVWTIAGIIGILILPSFVAHLLESLSIDIPPVDYSRFDTLRGNLPLLLFWFVIAWTTAAFGEEMLQRGFLLNRFADLFGGGKLAFAFAVVAQAVMFGLAHLYQGLSGIIGTGIVGLVMGVIYLTSKRSLWPLILAHGLVDTAGIIMLYLRAGPMQ